MHINSCASASRQGKMAPLNVSHMLYWSLTYSLHAMQEEHTKPLLLFHPETPTPARPQQLANLATGTKEYPFDVLIVGGGATGAGIAVDAATR